MRVAVELDGFAYHSSRQVFVYDRMRQNDIAACGYVVLRFSHHAIREETARSVSQLQAVLRKDPVLAMYLIDNPIVPVPDDMGSNVFLLSTPPPPRAPAGRLTTSILRVGTSTCGRCVSVSAMLW